MPKAKPGFPDYKLVLRRLKKSSPGSALEERISALGWTKSAFAQRLGVTVSYLSDVCKGKRPISLMLSLRLGQALECDPLEWVTLQNAQDLREKEDQIKPIERIR